jgi:hypothetical protein
MVSGIVSEFKSVVNFVAHKIFHIKSKESGEHHFNADKLHQREPESANPSTKETLTVLDSIKSEANERIYKIITEAEYLNLEAGDPRDEILYEKVKELCNKVGSRGEIYDKDLKDVAITFQTIRGLIKELKPSHLNTNEDMKKYLEKLNTWAFDQEKSALVALRNSQATNAIKDSVDAGPENSPSDESMQI